MHRKRSRTQLLDLHQAVLFIRDNFPVERSSWTLRKDVASGVLPAMRFGGKKLYFSKNELARFMEAKLAPARCSVVAVGAVPAADRD